jgi:hypothetical protein
LGVGEGHFAGADAVVEFVFELVFFDIAGAGFVGLGPEVFEVVRAAEFEGDEVVDFAAAVALGAVVFLVDLPSHVFGHVAVVGSPAGGAYVFGGSVGEYVAWGEFRVGAHGGGGVVVHNEYAARSDGEGGQSVGGEGRD